MLSFWLQECLPRQTHNDRRNACCLLDFAHLSRGDLPWKQRLGTLTTSLPCSFWSQVDHVLVTWTILLLTWTKLASASCTSVPSSHGKGGMGQFSRHGTFDIDRSCVALRVHFLVRLCAIASSRSVDLHHATTLVYFFAELLRRPRQNSAGTKRINPRVGLQKKPTRVPCQRVFGREERRATLPIPWPFPALETLCLLSVGVFGPVPLQTRHASC